jgi:aminoglycoside phosphotransferase (APT) family kinase protein
VVREWAAEVTVDEALARRLIGDQFPELEVGSLRLLGEGWDTTVWLVDAKWVFRFPRRSYPVPGLENEIAYLPRLGSRLPLPIPNPTFVGRPSTAFRWPFYGAPFLPGDELADAELDDAARAALARPLAAFLRALHDVELGVELPIDPVRRADMAFRVPRTAERLAELESIGLWTPPPLVGGLLESARELPPSEPTATCHGDLHIRHLLVDEHGAPSAVIDWIDLSRNDPSVDLVLYWSTLPPEGRTEFLDAYGALSEEQLLRARVLAFFLCATLAVWAHHEGVENVKREAVDSLERTATIMPSG